MMVRTRLRRMPDVEVVGEASNGREAIRLVAALAPEAVILDLEMPVMRGDEVIPKIREAAPGIRILLYSGADQDTLDGLDDDAKPDAVVSKGGALAEVMDQLRLLLDMGPYDVLRLVLGTIPLDQAVTVFDTWVGLNVRIFESLARGDVLDREQLAGATVEDLEALIGVYAHLGDNLQKAAGEGDADVVPVIHLLRTTAAAARRALVAFDEEHLQGFYKAWDYEVPASAATALSEMRDRLIEALPMSGAEEVEAGVSASTEDLVPSTDPATAAPSSSAAAAIPVADLVANWVATVLAGNPEAVDALYAAGAAHLIVAAGVRLHGVVARRELVSRVAGTAGQGMRLGRVISTPAAAAVEFLSGAVTSGDAPPAADVEEARLFCVVEFVGGLVSRERDYGD